MANDAVASIRDVPKSASRRSRRSHSGSPSSLPFIRQIRSRGEALFQDHGRRISKHQIRTLLICSLVITSLFYPAVGIYFWASKGGPGVSRGDAKSVWRSLSTPFMDSFASSGRKHVNSLSDLRMIWDDARDLRAIDVGDAPVLPDPTHKYPSSSRVTSTFARPRCQSVRVEHVLITTDDVMAGKGPRFGVLEKRILHSALQLQKSIEAEIRRDPDDDRLDSRPICLKARSSFPGRPSPFSHEADPHGLDACLTLSPLEFWSMDSQAILQDDDPAHLVSQSTLNRTRLGAPLSPSTTLAGRWHLFKRLPRAEYLALTFFLRQDHNGACSDSPLALPATSSVANSSPSHGNWHKLLTQVTGGQVRLIASPENISHSLVLQFTPDTPTSRRKPTHIFLLTAYAFVIIYVSRGLIKLRKVHSRFGLAFTGTTQLLISMIMSVSICALLDIRLTLVPWELLPFVIVVVGSENMFSLTKAILDTPLSLTVSARIAHGLGKVGVPITLTTLADILLLLVIAFFIGVRAVREFCFFAIFSLMMDWFLQMTFFVTVLSIDMQRLELADLLTQGTRLSRKQDSPNHTHDGPIHQNGDHSYLDADTYSDGYRRNGSPIRSTNIIVVGISKLWKARTARTASLTLFLVYMGGLYLYYGTGFPSMQQSSYVLPADWDTIRPAAASETTFDPFGHLDTESAPSLPWWTSSPSADLWSSLNPLGAHELRIDVQPWTILSLRSSSENEAPPSTATFAGWALFRPRIRAIIWFAKLVVLPISGTTALLWMLLLYLLKDTELLDAQRDKSEADPADGSAASASGPTVSVTPRTSVFANAHHCDVEILVHDNGVAASIDNGGGICIWRLDGPVNSSEDEERRTSIFKARTGLALDTSAVTAMALSAEAQWLAIGHASGRATFIATGTLETIWDHLPEDHVSPIVSLSLQHQESMHTLEASIALSSHRDGSIRVWNVARKESKLVPSPTHLDPRLRWKAVQVTVPHNNSNTSNNGSTTSALTFLGLSTAEGQFHIRAVEAGASSVKTVLTLNLDDRSLIYSALLCQLASRPPTADEAPLLRTSLLLGSANGRVRLIDFETAELIGGVDLEDGPVSGLATVDAGDPCTSAFVAQTTGRASLLIVSSGMAGAAAMLEKSGSLHSSLSAFLSGSPLRIRTPNGSRTNAANFWADGSAPPSPASEMANPLSYPMSSHGTASRLRRSSAHMRDRSGTGGATDSSLPTVAASSSLSVMPAMPPPANNTHKADDRQLRLLGWVRCQRGGCFATGARSLVAGVGRAQRAGSPSRWEWWSLDLRDELVLGRGGELIVPRQPLVLKSAEFASPRPSMQRQRNGRASFDLAKEDALAFSRLHPLHGFVLPQSQETALLFGFGGSLGLLRLKPVQN